MADDANFCDGRLRLTAFLRVVEHDLPRRPLRLKRRMPLAGEEYPRIAAPELLESESVLKTPSDLEGIPSPEADTEFDRLSSPAPAEVTPNESIAVSDRIAIGQRKLRVGKARLRKKGLIAHSQRANEPLSATRPKPSSTRKRRLPFNGLSLLRTTTLDRLPDPDDAHMAPTVPITELDPIDDSQLSTPHANGLRLQRLGAQRSENHATTISKVNRDMQQRRVNVTKKAGTAVPTMAYLSVPNRIKQHSLTGIRFVADGFVGEELDTVPVKKPPQRRKAVTRKPKPHVAVSGLALAGGVLPTPAIQCHRTLAASPSLHHAPANILLDHQNRADATQLPLIIAEGATTVKEVQRENAEHRQRAVHDQLSKITAPRRESESSGSDGLAEEQSIDSEENDNDDGLHETADTTHSTPLNRRSTFIEDHRYFESAMYHLDAEKEHGTVVEDLLFQ